ncbi:MAG TPA: hypothetical protein VIC08_08765 [Cellvibrionaceae bacterium]
MNDNDHQITVNEARSALASLDAAHTTTLNNMRPPLWLVLLCAAAFGIKTAAMGLMINNSLWQGIQWGTYGIIIVSVLSWIIALRVKGITVKITDITITKKGAICALIMCVLLVLSRAIYLNTGFILTPFIAGIANALLLAFCLHFSLRLNTKKGAGNEWCLF